MGRGMSRVGDFDKTPKRCGVGTCEWVWVEGVRGGGGGGEGQLPGCAGSRKFLESLPTQFSPKKGRPRAEDKATYLPAPPFFGL